METTVKELEKINWKATANLGKVCLDAAKAQMQDYELNRGSRDAWTYLHIAESNLISAARQGEDTSKHYKKLRRLQAERLQ